MILYNQNKKTVFFDFESSICINHGNTSNIYKIDDYILKKYYVYASDAFKLDIEILEILNQINSENMIKIYDLLYEDIDLSELSGYTAKYYEDKKINIFDKDLDYVLDNMNNIEKLFDELSKNIIRVKDLKYKNTILMDDKIILIDPDAYKKVNYSESSLRKINKKRLLSLFKNIYLCCLSKKDGCKKIYDLFDIKVDESTNITYELSKKMKKH